MLSMKQTKGMGMVFMYSWRWARAKDVTEHFGPVSNKAASLDKPSPRDEFGVKQYDNPMNKEVRNSKPNGLTHL